MTAFYTAYMFEGVSDPVFLHVTHKYLGKLTPDQVNHVTDIIQTYFAQIREFPRYKFDQQELFGHQPLVLALVPSKPVDLKDFHMDLRAQLDQFRADTYPEYRPHVTTNLIEVDLPISSYALIYGKDVLREWK